jgi:sec-independent protein translocase protein TatA
MLTSPVDIAMVAGVILLIFGPKKVPEFGKALGQGIGNFKKALSEAQDEFHTAVNTEPKKTEQKSEPPCLPADSAPAASPAAAVSAATNQPESTALPS